jgi:hypothetical protein
LRFEGILKIQFARKSPSKGQKPANSITSAHPISQPAQGIQNSSRTTKENTAERAGMAVAEFQDRCLKPLGHPSSLATSTTDALALADKVDIAGASP